MLNINQVEKDLETTAENHKSVWDKLKYYQKLIILGLVFVGIAQSIVGVYIIWAAY